MSPSRDLGKKKTPLPSFDDFIQAARLRKKNEALANEILLRDRNVASGMRTIPQAPSLASRVGISKRGVPLGARRPRSPFSYNRYAPTGPRGRYNRLTRAELMNAAVSDTERSFGSVSYGSVGQMQNFSSGVGRINIKGIASGPYIVVGQNFAPGTTAADIESAMTPYGTEILNCRIIAAKPTVIAELQFSEKSGAESVVAAFNNQIADGRKLNVYIKHGPPAPASATISSFHQISSDDNDTSMMDVEGTSSQMAYNGQREQADLQRERRRAEPTIQDGRYGFQERDAEQERPNARRADRRDDRDRYMNRVNDYASDRYPDRKTDDYERVNTGARSGSGRRQYSDESASHDRSSRRYR